MRFTFFDSTTITPAAIGREVKTLAPYRTAVAKTVEKKDEKKPEYALVHAASPALHEQLSSLKQRYKDIKHLVLIGIGGSSLGVEAVHAVLDTGAVRLTVLDTVSAHELARAQHELARLKEVRNLAVCVISKSGRTTETLVNASVLIDGLVARFGKTVYQQVVFIGDHDSDLLTVGKKRGAMIVTMPASVGGRFSVATEVGLFPLTLLQHDVDSFIEGFLAGSTSKCEAVAYESAARLHLYIKKGFTHYNFFAFEKRLATLGAWYRQLMAESIAKPQTKGATTAPGFVPTITTPVELHSISQLYFSDFPGVYTDFVTFDDETIDHPITKHGIAKSFSRFTVQEVTAALYGGVAQAYTKYELPYRATIFDEPLSYSLGLFMAIRMREIMYLASLLKRNAFDQPHVERYKKEVATILGV